MNRYKYGKSIWDELKRMGIVAVPNKVLCGISVMFYLPKLGIAIIGRQPSMKEIRTLYANGYEVRVCPSAHNLKYSIKVPEVCNNSIK